MRIEPAGMEDVAQVMALERETAEAPHWVEGEYVLAVKGGDAGLRRCLLVARSGGEIAGFVAGRVVAGVGEIENVVVRATARRAGTGRDLCAAVIGWARKHGAETVELEVRVGSAGARALYAGLGFVEAGRRVGYYGGPVEDALRMRLGAG